MWGVVIFGTIIVAMLGFCWAIKIGDAQGWDPDEPCDFWMTDDFQD